MSKSMLKLSSYGSFGSGSGVYEYEYEYEYEFRTSFNATSMTTSFFSSFTADISSQPKTIRVMGYGINLI